MYCCLTCFKNIQNAEQNVVPGWKTCSSTILLHLAIHMYRQYLNKCKKIIFSHNRLQIMTSACRSYSRDSRSISQRRRSRSPSSSRSPSRGLSRRRARSRRSKSYSRSRSSRSSYSRSRSRSRSNSSRRYSSRSRSRSRRRSRPRGNASSSRSRSRSFTPARVSQSVEAFPAATS